MRFEKLSNDKIRIILDLQDLEDNDIDYQSFMSNSSDSQKLFMEILDEAEEQIKKIERLGFGNLPVCIAKTQYSLSDDQKNLECLDPFKIHVKEVILKSGAEFVVAITGKIMTMPGLPQTPAAENIDISNDGEIIGIF